MGSLGDSASSLSEGYVDLTGSFGSDYVALFNVFVFAILIALYSVFTWKFYRYLSKRDLIDLDLQKYNKSTHPFFSKFFAVILYFIEYIVILPFLIFFWFAVLAMIILVLSEELAAAQVIVLSAAMVAAIRMLAYYEEDLSKDLAKIFPLTILVLFIISPRFFSLERIISNISEVPGFLKTIILFLILMVGVELILRIITVIVNLFKGESSSFDIPPDDSSEN